MKNIHVLPTDKPSNLFLWWDLLKTTSCLIFDCSWKESYKKVNNYINQNIYITNDEEIEKDEWCIDNSNEVFKFQKFMNYNHYKKIILTTDQDLIKDGVQAIDDTFLEWFIKNPSCEYVDLIGLRKEKGYEFLGYEIIIPKEEPKQHVEIINDNIEEFDKAVELFKQETLEEVAERKFPSKMEMYDVFKEGAKWQQERSYSEEEVLDLLQDFANDLSDNVINIKFWFEQFKKK